MIAVDLVSDCGEVMRYNMDQTRTYVRNSSHSAGTFKGVPVSVADVTEGTLRLTSIGGELRAAEEAETTDEATSFVDHLKSYGGEWMWRDLCMDDSSLEWVVESLREGTLVCVTDGSYFKKKAPNVCGAGWILANSRTKRQIVGTLI